MDERDVKQDVWIDRIKAGDHSYVERLWLDCYGAMYAQVRQDSNSYEYIRFKEEFDSRINWSFYCALNKYDKSYEIPWMKFLRIYIRNIPANVYNTNRQHGNYLNNYCTFDINSRLVIECKDEAWLRNTCYIDSGIQEIQERGTIEEFMEYVHPRWRSVLRDRLEGYSPTESFERLSITKKQYWNRIRSIRKSYITYKQG